MLQPSLVFIIHIMFMKRICVISLLATIVAMMTAIDASAGNPLRVRRFEFTDGFYHATGFFPSSNVGEMSVGYRITPIVKASVSAMSSEVDKKDMLWGVGGNISATPEFADRMYFIPSLGGGYLKGNIAGQKDEVSRAYFTTGVEVRYDVFPGFSCGFETKGIVSGKNDKALLMGFKLISKF